MAGHTSLRHGDMQSVSSGSETRRSCIARLRISTHTAPPPLKHLPIGRTMLVPTPIAVFKCAQVSVLSEVRGLAVPRQHAGILPSHAGTWPRACL
eukprot:3658895-Amphidinium_carterae.1